MKKTEMITVLERLEEYYRNFYNGTDKERVLNAWFPMFQDDPADEVNRAVVVYICTEKFAPTVSGIKNIMAENRMAGQMTEMQAWSKIRDAIKNAGDRYTAAEAFGKLPAILQKLVDTPTRLRDWRQCSDDTLEGVIASNVQRSYRELAKREAVWFAIPGQLQVEQGWRVDAPELIALPEPPKQMSHDERFAKMDEDAKTYREKYLAPQTESLAEKVSAFKAPFTDNELKMMAAKQRYEEKQRKNEADRFEKLERMRA